MRYLRFVPSILVFALFPLRSVAWSVEGHEVTAMVAQKHLNATAKKAITKLLTPSADDVPELWKYVVWADDIRAKESGQAVQKMAPHFFALQTAADEYEKFKVLPDFKGNASWHFVNLPVSATAYAKVPGSKTDVVEAIAHCVNILETSDDPFTQKWALIFLIHVVGDLHQPLHCVAGYFDLSDKAHPKFHDKQMPGDISDSGANALHVVSDKDGTTTNLALHHFWDENLVSGIGKEAQKVADSLVLPADTNAGDSKQWPAQWVAQSLPHARKAYANLSFGTAVKDENDHWVIPTKLPGGEAGYKSKMEPSAAEQLARAGQDMADLLNRIKWSTLK